MSFHEQLKRARTEMGYTQQQVADVMGITNSTYCGYEIGKRQPDVAKIKQLAAILHTTGDYLLEISPEPHDTCAIHLPFPKEIAQKYELLHKEARQIADRLILDLWNLQETEKR